MEKKSRLITACRGLGVRRRGAAFTWSSQCFFGFFELHGSYLPTTAEGFRAQGLSHMNQMASTAVMTQMFGSNAGGTLQGKLEKSTSRASSVTPTGVARLFLFLFFPDWGGGGLFIGTRVRVITWTRHANSERNIMKNSRG